MSDNKKGMFERVSEMNTAFGNPKGDPKDINWERLEKQCDNIHDEYKELMTAIAECDLHETRDALCDIMVFALGGLHFIGIDAKVDPTRSPVEHGNPLDFDWELLKTGCSIFEPIHADLMDSIKKNELSATITFIAHVVENVVNAYAFLGLDLEADMDAVVIGVLTRFCQNEQDYELTAKKYLDLGVEFYIEGQFPALCLKSAKDQQDKNGENYPKGKFLKSVSYSTTVFPPIVPSVEIPMPAVSA